MQFNSIFIKVRKLGPRDVKWLACYHTAESGLKSMFSHSQSSVLTLPNAFSSPIETITWFPLVLLMWRITLIYWFSFFVTYGKFKTCTRIEEYKELLCIQYSASTVIHSWLFISSLPQSSPPSQIILCQIADIIFHL